MQNLFKTLLISLLLPHLALGQTAVLISTAEDIRPATPTAVANKSPRPASKTWLRQNIISVASIGLGFGLALIAGWVAVTARAEKQKLLAQHNQTNTEFLESKALCKNLNSQLEQSKALNQTLQTQLDSAFKQQQGALLSLKQYTTLYINCEKELAAHKASTEQERLESQSRLDTADIL
jgi:uncharacterized protein HemX